MEKSKNFKITVTDMGLIIINRLSGWKEKFDEFFNILFGPNERQCLVFKLVYRHYTNNIETAEDFVQFYASYILERIGVVECDAQGNPKPVIIDYDPSECNNPKVLPFVNFFTNRRIIYNRYIDFQRCKLRYKTKYHEKNESEFNDAASEDEKKENFTDETSTVHFNKRKSTQRCNVIFNDVVIPYFLEYWDNKLKTELPSTKNLPEINNYHIMVVFQLYPQIIGCEAVVDDDAKYEKYQEDWFKCNSPFNYDEKGLGRAIDKTFERSKINNPDSPPEKIMYKCHLSSRRYGSIQKQKANTLKKILDRNFAPIDESQALECFSLTTKHKSLYLTLVEKWFDDDATKSHLQELIKIYKSDNFFSA